MSSEVNAGPGISRDHHCPTVANTSLVAPASATVNSSSLGTTKPPGSLALPHSKMLHPLRKNLTMVACQLSGNLTEAKAFQRHLVSSSLTPGDWEPESSMAPTCGDGLTFVLKRKLIICNHLWN